MKKIFLLRLAGFFSPALAIIALDQTVKWYVELRFALYSKYTVLEGILEITRIRNKGAAFGILSGGDSSITFAFFTAASLAVMAAIAIFYLRLRGESLALGAGLITVFGGAAGNLIDRIRLGEVVDFINFHLGRYYWPAFNVADISISVGVGLILLNVLRKGKAD